MPQRISRTSTHSLTEVECAYIILVMPKNYSSEVNNPLSSNHEDYLKAIYLLEARGEQVTNSALSQYIGLAPASATNMVKKLAQMGLVDYRPYQSVALTETGKRVALEILRHHRLLELFLHKTLDIPWERVHEEAERLEHVISEALEDAIAASLGYPKVDPHGDPIPSKNGEISHAPSHPLSTAEAGHTYRLVRVLSQDTERLAYLGRLGLRLDVEIHLREQAPFDGPVLVEVDGEAHALAIDMAALLQVVPLSEEYSALSGN